MRGAVRNILAVNECDEEVLRRVRSSNDGRESNDQLMSRCVDPNAAQITRDFPQPSAFRRQALTNIM